MNSCSIVIVNYNTGTVLKSVVDKALKNPDVAQVLVVDNASHDNSMGLLKESDRLKKYHRQSNHGFASSCNYGAAKIGNEFVMFLNPDCLIKEHTVQQLMCTLSQHKQAAIIGCLINNPDGTEQRAARRRLPTLLRAIKTFSGIDKLAKWCGYCAGVNMHHLPMPTTITQVEAISGALIMMRLSVFNEIGGFDETYPLHFEDLDLFKRIIDRGYDILFDPNISAIHHQGTSSRSNSRVSQWKKAGLERYFQKHGSYLAYRMVKLFNHWRS